MSSWRTTYCTHKRGLDRGIQVIQHIKGGSWSGGGCICNDLGMRMGSLWWMVHTNPNLRWLKRRFYRTSIDKQTILGMCASFLLSTLNYVLYVWDIPSLYHAHTGRWPCLSNPNQQGMYMWMNQICEESPQRDWMIDDPHTWGLSNTTGELQTWIHTSEVTLEG